MSTERPLFPANPILLVDDEEHFLRISALTLAAEGINNIVMCSDSRKVLAHLRERPFSVVTLDINMPSITGTELLRMITKDHPEVAVIMITSMEDIKTAVECIRAGAYDYLVKPARKEELSLSLRKALELQEYRSETKALKSTVLTNSLKDPEAFSEIVSRSEPMHNIFRYVEAVAPTWLPVLVMGETGCGKELLARAIHKLSGRKGQLVSLNVAGVDDTMFSDTLFGHRKGSFSGADRDRRGLIEEASDGTLFLDEIGDLAPESQVKILRLLQDGSYYPLGSDVPKRSSARVVTATNCDLAKLRDKGVFRKDLYYRLEAHNILLPPLRQRREDLPLLLEHFLEIAAAEMGKKKPHVPPALVPLLENYSFPGNVRELRGMIYDALSRHSSGILSLDVFRAKVGTDIVPSSYTVAASLSDSLITFPQNLPTLEIVERALIDEALKRSKGNKTLAAQMLGLTRQTLNNWLRRVGSETE